jgi:hypothetical protein
MRGLIGFFLDSWRDQRIDIGPLVLTTQARAARASWNAFELGRDHGAHHGPVPRAPVRHLRSV